VRSHESYSSGERRFVWNVSEQAYLARREQVPFPVFGALSVSSGGADPLAARSPIAAAPFERRSVLDRSLVRS